jgi:hypothetical protein
MRSSRHADDRPPTGPKRPTPAQRRADLVIAVLAGKISSESGARHAQVSDAEFAQWIDRFVEAGKVGLQHGSMTVQPVRSADLKAQNDALRVRAAALRAEAERWRNRAGNLLGPFRDIEEIRLAEKMSVARFCALLRMSRRSYFRQLVRLRSGETGSTRRPAPCIEKCTSIVAVYMAVWPEYGHRKLHALMMADGHITSPSTVLRAMRRSRRKNRSV